MSLAGHAEPWRTWRAALAGDRLHHAWLLAGRKGLGKATFAAAAARELVAPSAARHHPDILSLELLPDKDEDVKRRDEGKPFQTKRNIRVDQIRAMQARLTTRATLGTWRAVIVDAADDLERAAANALLKSLEEPPQGTIFLLVAHRPGRLPATIRSRCRVLRFADLADEQIAAVLDSHEPGLGRDTRDAAVAAAFGSPGAALAFVARDLGKAQRLMERLAANGDRDLTLRAALADEIGGRADRERMAAALELARGVLARAVAGADRAGQQRIVEAHTEIAGLIGEAPTANFDPTVLLLEIGGLLASAAPPREAPE